MLLNDLFVFELANNHQGQFEHGLRIIQEVARISKAESIRGAVKFQFRNLDTFIHPNYKSMLNGDHIARFFSTRMSLDEFSKLVTAAKKNALITVCTPFDEASVIAAVDMDFDIIKVASCSALDWPLLEKIKFTKKPLIVSTAGRSLEEIEGIVALFSDVSELALMHCVSLYPTPPQLMNLNKISLLKKNFPNLTIGFSTHEKSDDFETVKLAVAKGAQIFEKHVGISSSHGPLNAYSANPEQVEKWLQSYKAARLACSEPVSETIIAERKSLEKLTRGIFAARVIAKGHLLTGDDVFFALPFQGSPQLSVEQWRGNLVADRDYVVGQGIESGN